MPTRLMESRVVIVGLGLMGGSLAGALRGQCQSVTGVARREEAIKKAIKRRLIDRGTTDLAAAVRHADIVVLAMPVRAIIDQLAEIGPLLPEGCLLMDLGSTKGQVVDQMALLPEHVQPLGGHPMCGKESSGIEVADIDLYRGCTFILSPLPRTSGDALELGKALAQAAGASPLILEAHRQDFLVGTMSHLPYLLACVLVSTADAVTSPDPAAWEIVAGGFRDTSRVAGSDVTMMLDILMTNQEEIVKAVSVCQEHLDLIVQLLQSGSEQELRERLDDIRATRMEMFP